MYIFFALLLWLKRVTKFNLVQEWGQSELKNHRQGWRAQIKPETHEAVFYHKTNGWKNQTDLWTATHRNPSYWWWKKEQNRRQKIQFDVSSVLRWEPFWQKGIRFRNHNSQFLSNKPDINCQKKSETVAENTCWIINNDLPYETWGYRYNPWVCVPCPSLPNVFACTMTELCVPGLPALPMHYSFSGKRIICYWKERLPKKLCALVQLCLQSFFAGKWMHTKTAPWNICTALLGITLPEGFPTSKGSLNEMSCGNLSQRVSAWLLRWVNAVCLREMKAGFGQRAEGPCPGDVDPVQPHLQWWARGKDLSDSGPDNPCFCSHLCPFEF